MDDFDYVEWDEFDDDLSDYDTINKIAMDMEFETNMQSDLIEDPEEYIDVDEDGSFVERY